MPPGVRPVGVSSFPSQKEGVSQAARARPTAAAVPAVPARSGFLRGGLSGWGVAGGAVFGTVSGSVVSWPGPDGGSAATARPGAAGGGGAVVVRAASARFHRFRHSWTARLFRPGHGRWVRPSSSAADVCR
ncbi:hypothetical protein BJ962_006793 [Streptomyces aureorectus]|nr:hypothetical protein [Streptomyces calvus]